MKQRIIVIGSGLGGLAAAIRLAAKGHQVEVFEQRDKPGGKAYVYQTGDYSFDSGPTVITAPFLFDDLWQAAGKRREDYFQLEPCVPYYRIFDQHGRFFDYTGDHAATLQQIEQWNPADKEGYERFIATTRAIFQKGFVELADKPFLHFGDMVKVVPDLVRLQSYLSVYQYVARFIQNDFLRRCFSFHPLFIGGNPFASSSIYAMIHHVEKSWGVHYAVGGTASIVAAMVRLLQELGGVLHLNTPVQEILVDGRRVTGVRLADGSVERADSVVSNADVTYTYRTLIPAQYRHKYTNRRLERMQHSMSLFVIYFGTNRRYRDTPLVHHNIIFGQRYKELLNDIFRRHHLASDFSLYVHAPSLDDRTVAPPNGETFYVLSPVPNLEANIDWAQAAKPYRDLIMQFLEDNFLPDLRQHIAVEHVVDPRYFQQTQNNYMGAAFSVQPTLLQSAWFRPHNRSEDFANLYIVGAGTHPGAGVPGVLSSALIVENLIGAADASRRTMVDIAQPV